ncbi:DUF4124 domain-containing protein [Pseudidiomarina sp. PP-1MA]|uniref:DUF4124 domain-containing protein n=1 Tax=Pseudidiomarina sp. PP-1MA TaxID=3237706 RepID=A0AB39X5Q4_9GAMM
MLISRLMVVIMLAVAVSTAAAQQVYKRQNADGSVTYSDQPLPQAEVINLQPVPVTEFTTHPPVTTQTQTAMPTVTDAAAPMAQIIAPAQQAAVRANDGSVAVRWQTTPNPLPDGYQLQLRVDQRIAWQGSSQTELTLTDIDRGERRLQLRVLDAEGNEVSRSDTIVVYVLRANINSPALATGATSGDGGGNDGN